MCFERGPTLEKVNAKQAMTIINIADVSIIYIVEIFLDIIS